MTRQQKKIPYNAMNHENILRVALYCRVSTEEQVLHGYSLQAQEDALLEWVKDKPMKIVGIYRDEGHSARQPVMKRKVMQELIADVKAGKIDEIIFTKLDRWFRSVSDYHKVQDILDAHKVGWKTILEAYDTATADGRLKINIMLSVAENEADRTSERIQFVLNQKRKDKVACMGGPNLPVGYKKEIIDGVRRLVKDPVTEPVIVDFWAHLKKYQSVRQAGMFVNEKYGINRSYRSWQNVAKRDLYTGTYRGVEDYCEPYISKEDWEEIQRSHVTIRKTQRPERVYLFTGLMRCPYCGLTLKATFKTYPNDRSKEYVGYRCSRAQTRQCPYTTQVSERKAEKFLLQNIREELEKYILEVEVQQAKPKKKPPESAVKKLEEKLRRVNVSYFNNNMDDDEYAQTTADIKAQIEKMKQEIKGDNVVDLDKLRTFLDTDFETIYQTLSKEDKRRMWRSIIEEIHIEGTAVKSVKFRG